MNKDLEAMQCMINAIRNAKSPGMFLGSVSIIRLQIFLDGFVYAQTFMNKDCQYPQYYVDFNKYVMQYFKNSSNAPWATIILQQYENEEQAFELFYELFDEFIKSIEQ